MLSFSGSNWNYRLQWEHETRRVGLVGWKLETTSVPLRENNDIAWVAVSGIVGIHIGSRR